MTIEQFLKDYHTKVYSGSFTLQAAKLSLEQALLDFSDNVTRINLMLRVVEVGLANKEAKNQSAALEEVRSLLAY